MTKNIIGVFRDSKAAEQAVRKLQSQGIAKGDISIVARDNKGKTGGRDMEAAREPGGMAGAVDVNVGHEDVGSGLSWGGTLGGLGGLLAGLGALAIPGIGPVVAAGPIAATITGATGGGLAGGLLDLGVPEQSGKKYEEKIKQGEILAAAKVPADKTDEAARIFRDAGATDVEVH